MAIIIWRASLKGVEATLPEQKLSRVNPPPIDPYAAKRKLLSKLSLVGIFGGQLLVAVATGLGRARSLNLTQGMIVASLCVAGVISTLAPVLAAAKLQKEHPLEKKTSALDSLQFALAQTEARLQSKNDRDQARFGIWVISSVGYIFALARELSSTSPNVRGINSFCVFLVISLVMGLGALRGLRRHPLKFEALADAQGLTIRHMRYLPQHFAWDQFGSVELAEEFLDSGAQQSLDLNFRDACGELLASVRLSSFKAEDAAQFQGVVARYCKRAGE